ncbi:hypothetical protein [Caminibacter pacificus]|uniref:Uncharacterized protein n=1 Tax=Caminibacter pacificus TaxID=1424653 RepID=A0AAJ4RBV5_9BACT|nr:hypothetical protein [Caminibacter pacificus]NPA88300.1 hypothetical protein [Campylobacterota bacterium]QCI28859.1 hypothetical protein C6V80_07730 [Caminibacter pacificus]ROR39450.1 hypothetical protein EDC58_1390 [Caminibacter pacificus]
MRFVPAYITLEFDEYNEKFKEEYDKLGSESEDPIGQYIKLAKARGETRDTDPVLLELLIALHRKVDELTALVKNEKKELLPLKYKTETEGLGFEYFKIKEPMLEKGKKYYGRFDLPVFPERKVPVIFEGYDNDIGKILFMHEKDEKDYNAYITARERAIIREMKKNG